MEYFKEIKATKIFKDASEFECQAMMFCFKTRFKMFNKNAKIVNQGDKMDDVILILKGSAIAQNIDSLGNISILTQLNKGDVYGVESAYAGEQFYKDSVITNEKTLVMFLNRYRLINTCDNRCKKHEIIIKHLMKIIAESNIKLQDKISHMSKKTIRDKVLSYFHSVKMQAKSSYFEIPFNKTELANFLSVDRSALSNELSKMKQEGILDYDKNQYRFLEK